MKLLLDVYKNVNGQGRIDNTGKTGLNRIGPGKNVDSQVRPNEQMPLLIVPVS